MTVQLKRKQWSRRVVPWLLIVATSFLALPVLPAKAAIVPPNDGVSTPMVFAEGGLRTATIAGATAEATDLGSGLTRTVWFQAASTVPAVVDARAFRSDGSGTVPAFLTRVDGATLVPLESGSAVPAGTLIKMMVGSGPGDPNGSYSGAIRVAIDLKADFDADAIADEVDNCVGVTNPTQEDSAAGGRIPNDGLGDACEAAAGIAPVNDRLTAATMLTFDPYNGVAFARGTNRDATFTAGEDDLPGTSGSAIGGEIVNSSVWYTFAGLVNSIDYLAVESDYPTQVSIGGSEYIQVAHVGPANGPFLLRFNRALRSPTEDADGDGIKNVDDSCPDTVNPIQQDTDLDGLGNACDDTPGQGLENDDPEGALEIVLGARGPIPSNGTVITGSTADATTDRSGGRAVWFHVPVPEPGYFEFELSDAFGANGGRLAVFATDLPGAFPIELRNVETVRDGSVYSAPGRVGEDLYVAVIGHENADAPNEDFILKGFRAFNRDALGSTPTVTVETNLTLPRSTVNATRQSGEPSHAGSPTGASVWDQFRFSRPGTLTISTEPVDPAAIMRVALYNGPVGATDPSQLVLPAVANAESGFATPVERCSNYHLATDTATPGALGLVNLQFSPAPGSTPIDCDNPPTTVDITLDPTVTVLEGQYGVNRARMNFTLSGALPDFIKLRVQATPGTATPGADYNSLFGEFFVSPNTTSGSVEIPILPDQDIEPNETFTVSWATIDRFFIPSSITINIATPASVVTIVDDDSPIPVSASTKKIYTFEGDGTAETLIPGALAIKNDELIIGHGEEIITMTPSGNRVVLARGTISTTTPNVIGALAIDIDGSILASVPRIGLLGRVDGGGIVPLDAGLVYANQIAVDDNGNIYWTDGVTNTIRRRNRITGAVTVLAGVANTTGFTADGYPAAGRALNGVNGLAVHPSGTMLYFTEGSTSRVRRIDLVSGVLSTVTTRILNPSTLRLHGNTLYVRARDSLFAIGDPETQSPLMTQTMISKIAGTTPGFGGDGGLATDAQLNEFGGEVVVDSAGNLYIGDNLRVRVVGAVPPPRLEIRSPEEGATVNTAVTPILFGFNRATGATCSVDGAPPTSCTSPFETPTLSLGAHTVTVTALGETESFSRTLHFTFANLPPVAVADELWVTPGSVVGAVRNVGGNDRDPEGGALTFALLGQASKGTASCTSLGICRYIPYATSTGTDVFSYRVTDVGNNSSTGIVTVTISQAPPQGQKVLILGSTVKDGYDSVEATEAKRLGFEVEVLSDVQWAGLSTVDVRTYRAIVLGDNTCGGSVAAAVLNRSEWGPAITGNVIMNGTDPVLHGKTAVTANSIRFATASPGRTGAYISLSCYFHGAAPGTAISLLEPFGSFAVTGVGCYDDAHIVASHPALVGLTDTILSNWGCSVHEGFSSWPTDFTPIAIARNVVNSYTAPDGSTGIPYMLARGDGLAAGNISLSPISPISFTSTSRTLTALVSSGGVPQNGRTVSFEVVTGPNTGVTGSATTAADGYASFAYTSTVPGIDVVTASYNDGTRTQTSNTATVTWQINPAGAADSFIPVAPVRLLDTRPTPMLPGGVRPIQVVGVAGVPVGATAVSLNVAAVTPVRAGHLRVFPTGGAVPTASVLNFGAGKNTPNHVVVPIGADGSVSVYAGDTTNVIVDINGYFLSDGSGSQYVPVVSPTRILVPSFLPGAATTTPSSINVAVLGSGGIPASGVSAVLVNVGALNPTTSGHLRVYSAGDPLPDSSTHNFSAGDSRMNLVLVRPGADGKITVYNAASGSVTVTVDTVGYFTSVGQSFKPVRPIRAIDTRELAFGDGLPVAPGAFREVQIRGFAGIPVGARNVVINVAAVNPAGVGSIDVGPSGASPVLPSFMHPLGENVANLVVVPIGSDGKIRIVNNSLSTTHVIADITGYFIE
jgi:hypothetical protein